MTEERVYISALAVIVNRREDTVRGWCRQGRLPARLMPRREKTSSGVGWRYWTPEQVEGIREWMVERRMHPGAGLRNWDGSGEESDAMLDKLRRRQVA